MRKAVDKLDRAQCADIFPPGSLFPPDEGTLDPFGWLCSAEVLKHPVVGELDLTAPGGNWLAVACAVCPWILWLRHPGGGMGCDPPPRKQRGWEQQQQRGDAGLAGQDVADTKAALTGEVNCVAELLSFWAALAPSVDGITGETRRLRLDAFYDLGFALPSVCPTKSKDRRRVRIVDPRETLADSALEKQVFRHDHARDLIAGGEEEDSGDDDDEPESSLATWARGGRPTLRLDVATVPLAEPAATERRGVDAGEAKLFNHLIEYVVKAGARLHAGDLCEDLGLTERDTTVIGNLFTHHFLQLHTYLGTADHMQTLFTTYHTELNGMTSTEHDVEQNRDNRAVKNLLGAQDETAHQCLFNALLRAKSDWIQSDREGAARLMLGKVPAETLEQVRRARVAYESGPPNSSSRSPRNRLTTTRRRRNECTTCCGPRTHSWSGTNKTLWTLPRPRAW